MNKALFFAFVLFAIMITGLDAGRGKKIRNNIDQGIASAGTLNKNAQAISKTNTNAIVNNTAKIQGDWNIVTQVGVAHNVDTNVVYARNAPLMQIGSPSN